MCTGITDRFNTTLSGPALVEVALEGCVPLVVRPCMLASEQRRGDRKTH